MIWPLIWLCTVTVASGVTAPRPISVIGMSPDCTRAATTGIGPPPAKRPGGGRVRLGGQQPREQRDRGQHGQDDEHTPGAQLLLPLRPVVGVGEAWGTRCGVAIFVVH